MKLWYIAIWIPPETGYDNEYRYEFTLHTRFISNFLSKQIRKQRFQTDGTFNMISVNVRPTNLGECRLRSESALTVDVLFDREKYEQIKNTNDYSYYLELFAEGFTKASRFKKIPLDGLLNLLDEFRKLNCKNEWIHKKKRFPERDLEIILNCHFTTLDFRLIVTVNKISSKQKLFSKTILKTEPDEICFQGEFKDIFLTKDTIVITDRFDEPRFRIKIPER